MMDEEGGGVSAATGINDMIKLLIEDRQKREEEYGVERLRREAEMDRRPEEMVREIEMLTRLVGDRNRLTTAVDHDKVKLTKLCESDDIEAHLKTSGG